MILSFLDHFPVGFHYNMNDSGAIKTSLHFKLDNGICEIKIPPVLKSDQHTIINAISLYIEEFDPDAKKGPCFLYCNSSSFINTDGKQQKNTLAMLDCIKKNNIYVPLNSLPININRHPNNVELYIMNNEDNLCKLKGYIFCQITGQPQTPILL